MAEKYAIPADTQRRQAAASDPSASAWVSANAGSGKTTVLARRVIRLLLAGVAPARVLCLTFTKAAAAEMSNRIFEVLAKWVTAEATWLEAELAELLDRASSPAERIRARTLFALALDTPGGLKIQTIHAFCEALLHQFPLEANVPGHFEVVDELRQGEMLEEARLATVRAMDQGGDTRLRDAFAWLIDHASDMAIDKALKEIIAIRERFSDWVGGDLDTAMAPLWQRFGIGPEMTEDEVLALLMAEPALDEGELERIAETARRIGGSLNAGFGERVDAFLDASSQDSRFRLQNSIFLTQKQAARKQWVTNAVLAEHPDAQDRLQAAAGQTEASVSRLNSWRMLRASQALFYFADQLLDRYDHLKRNGALVDFGDLIFRAANLLNRAEAREWIRYKLDRGIDHVLIDEAQDTSREQWAIVDAITQEFFAGEGSADAERTIFAVGDEKQSIFSFQGAAPAMFAEQAEKIARDAKAAGVRFEHVRLHLSFRSSPDILGAVDRVFENPDNARGLGGDATSGTVHDAIRANDPGEVRVWPILAKAPSAEKTEWLAPIDAEEPGDPAVLLAKRIASTVRSWIDHGDKLPGHDRAIRHGDILILVRRRDRFMTAVIRELKEAGLNIAGADRLKLTEHIAVEDLMALGRVMVLPEDDLSLAGVLKSPLFGLDDEALIELCHGRDRVSLYDHLARLGEDDGPAAAMAGAVHTRLTRLRSIAMRESVYGFYAHVLGREGGRKAFVGRLGSEAEDILDAFERAALDHDRQSGTSGGGLERFIAELDLASPEIKREVDVRRDEIRVITVHAAKGLEAPIVFLVDPCSPAFIRQHAPSVIALGGEGDGADYVWAAGGNRAGPEIDAQLAAIRQEAEEEYRRLLYVAMTRAADRLVVCGYRGIREPTEDHWHAMVERALTPDARQVFDEDGNLCELVWQRPDEEFRRRASEKPLKEEAERPVGEAGELPVWLRTTARAEPALPRPLNPSAALALTGRPTPEAPETLPEDAGDLQSGIEQRRIAIERGTAIHRLLQMLPDTMPEDRERLAMAWLERNCPAWDAATRSEALAEAVGVLGDPALAPLFGPQSRAEAGIAGHVGVGGRDVLVSGQIDRLAVTDDEIVLADFKTNRVVPADAAGVSEAYRLQLALYRALLGDIYPEKPVRCLLVWTRTGVVHALDGAELDASLGRLQPS